ncbi:hypothetical protein COCNU_07G007940 [Cocos nucifera]|uniref:Uncharacterized protein n=1 Tax=Cocos nucifera TaxID=13894 RepID=A0A8K0N4X3_COCNU|nr:hypothetical protein COCNU_07G007940 [Cocos nucifera]
MEVEEHELSPEPQGVERPELMKVFLPVSEKMASISAYLDRAAMVETYGRPVKTDDVAGILEPKARKAGSWFTREVAHRKFFVACLDKQMVLALMAEGHIKGDGFTAMVNQFSGRVRHKSRYKVYATLPLFRRTAEAVAGIISGFAIPHRASQQFKFKMGGSHAEDITDIKEKVEVTVASRIYTVGIVINFIPEQNRHLITTGCHRSQRGAKTIWMRKNGNSGTDQEEGHHQMVDGVITNTEERRSKF